MQFGSWQLGQDPTDAMPNMNAQIIRCSVSHLWKISWMDLISKNMNGMDSSHSMQTEEVKHEWMDGSMQTEKETKAA